MSPRSNRKPRLGQRSTSQKHVIWSQVTGQRITCFDRCQLIMAEMSNMKEVHGKPRLYVSVNLFFGVWPPCCVTPSSCVMRPRAIQLAMITIRKILHGFPVLSHDDYGAPLGGPSGRRSSAINECILSRICRVARKLISCHSRLKYRL